MEMDFPHNDIACALPQELRDHRALLAAAIARQAAGWTARAMMASSGHNRRTIKDDVMEQRIQYFSTHQKNGSSIQPIDDQPFGAFSPQFSKSPPSDSKDEDVVYHAGSTIRKTKELELALVDEQPDNLGLGVSRTI